MSVKTYLIEKLVLTKKPTPVRGVVGGAGADFPAATWDVARWCKRPTGPERRLQGRRPAGVRLGPQGPALLLALDAPGHHPGPLYG